MRILICSHYSANYGANRSLFDLMQGLLALDYQFLVIIPDRGDFVDLLESAQIPYHIERFHPMTFKAFRKSSYLKKRYHKQNLSAVQALKKVVEDFNPDYIYSNSSVMDLGARLSEASKIPHIWHLREMAELHYHYKFYPSKARFLDYLREAKLLIPISNAVQKAVLEPHQISNYKIISDAVFSKEDFEQLLTTYPARKNSSFIFLTVGLLHPSKQQALIIKAFQKIKKKHSNLELWIAGGGSILYKSYLKWLIFKYGLQKQIKLLGYVSNIRSLYAQANAVVIASKHEGLGRTTIEGMAFEKPVLGLDSGATTELIQHQKTGFLFKNVQELVESMQELIEKPDLAAKMGENGRNFVRNHFLIEDYVEQLHQLFLKMKESSPLS